MEGGRMKNKILHIDCDAFYASCEELRRPDLKEKPLAVGGLSNKSVITTANYPARKYGVRSAMPVFMAREKCPNLIILPVDRKYYKEKSMEVFEIVKKYAHVFEQVSIDEAYIEIDEDSFRKNISFIKYYKNKYRIKNMSAKLLALSLQEEIFQRTGINVSIGLSYNKFLAKLASDRNKPHGFKEISFEDMPEILEDLPISKVHGIGKKTEVRLKNIGIYKISDLMRLDQDFLYENFGKNGLYIYQVIRGRDKRKVQATSVRKSMARETTFRENTNDKKILYSYLDILARELESDLAAKNIQGKTINIKIKSEDFKTQTKSLTLQEPIHSYQDIYDLSKDLLDQIQENKYLRLIGISLSNLSDRKFNQLSFI